MVTYLAVFKTVSVTGFEQHLLVNPGQTGALLRHAVQLVLKSERRHLLKDRASRWEALLVDQPVAPRSPASVFAAADEGPVTITRRDGEALVLTRASAVEHQRLGLQLAAQLIAASLADSSTPFVDRLRPDFRSW